MGLPILIRFGVLVKQSTMPEESTDVRWKELYIAALFENDKAKLAHKIAEAQMAIIERRRKSLMAHTDTKERQVLDTALLSLQALANCLAITPNLMARVRAASVPSADVAA